MHVAAVISYRECSLIEFEGCVPAPPPHMSHRATNNMKVLVLCSLFFSLLVHAARCVPNEGSPLPRATAKPVNVDPKLDCAVKELAWEFVNQLLSEQVYT